MADMLAFLAAHTTRTLDDYSPTAGIAEIASTDAFIADFEANDDTGISAAATPTAAAVTRHARGALTARHET